MKVTKTLEKLTTEAKNSAAGEFITLMDFLNDCYKDNMDGGKDLLIASCDEFIAYAQAIKKDLRG